jgi:hypothetical protein
LDVIDVDGLVFDDVNEAKFAVHGVSVVEVQEVFEGTPEYFENLIGRRAPYVMLGTTRAERMLLVPIERWGSGNLWRPVTAYEPRTAQAARFKENVNE